MIIFVVSEWINKKGFMNSEDIVDLKEMGVEVGSHGKKHGDMSSMNRVK